MYRFAKAALNVTGRAVQQVRHGSTSSEEFHAKYGTAILLGGGAFCTAVWSHVLLNVNLVYNVSPVGKLQPKEWRESDE